MIKAIEAIYQSGFIRPVEPLELPEGSRLNVVVITHEDPGPNCNAAEILAEIAALPLEGASNHFSAREHDSILYPKKSICLFEIAATEENQEFSGSLRFRPIKYRSLADFLSTYWPFGNCKAKFNHPVWFWYYSESNSLSVK